MSIQTVHPSWPSILPELKEREDELIRDINRLKRSGRVDEMDRRMESLETLREFIKECEA